MTFMGRNASVGFKHVAGKNAYELTLSYLF